MVVIKLSDPKVRVDERTRLHGYIAPHAWRVDIAAQFRNRQGVWRTFIVDRTDDTGRFSWKIKSSAAGTFPIRVITEAKGGLAEGISNHVVLNVA